MSKLVEDYTTPVGVLIWGSLIEPSPNLSDRLEWSLGLELPDDQLGPFCELVGELADRGAQQLKGWPANFNTPLKPAKTRDESGNLQIKEGFQVISAKRKTEIRGQQGMKKNTAPVIVDGAGKPINKEKVVSIPPGSKVRAKLSVFAYGKAGQFGVGCGINAVQIVELAESRDQFDAIEGGWTQGESESDPLESDEFL